MKFELFKTLYTEALEYGEDKEMYIAERGWQEWMQNYPPTETLEVIWSLAKGTVKENREKYNLSRAAFSRRNNIPTRTLENWDSGVNSPQDYVKMLIDYTLVEE
ncbi:helix-turn-helix domain-containing protein [Jeotgalibaca porci]|uniref:helix-turn-helix domain-containing protein n=1 Tax=Jeotgalibaca porci TaxID=1868793 RepID=UPI0035A1729C